MQCHLEYIPYPKRLWPGLLNAAPIITLPEFASKSGFCDFFLDEFADPVFIVK